ncbi:MAG: ABC transporter substrate-binding protein [Actinobacteria bacterium]|nr:ABC transporter substrate-binding protein [Actinomycetota bacterium]
MRSWRGLVVFGALLVVTAACNGSSAQRDALLRLNGVGGAQASGSAAPDQTGGTVPYDAASAAPEVPAAGSAAASPGAGSGVAAPLPGAATPGSKLPASGGSRSASSAAPASGRGSQAPAAGSGAAAPSAASAASPAPGAGPAQQNGNTDVGVTSTAIKVGHIGIYSGPVGYVGQNLSLAARATLQSINDAGGVNGRKLDVLVRDDGWDGTKGINAARDLVEREKVFAICCTQSVSTTDPLTAYADQQKVPNVAPDGWGLVQYGGQWSWPLGVPAISEARVLAKWQVKTQGVKKAALLHLNSPTGQSFRDGYKEVLEKMGGKLEVVQAASFDDPGTTTLLARARAANVDTIAIYADSGIVARLMREAAGQNYKPPKGFAGSTFYYFNVTPELTGPAGEGLISSSHWTPHDLDTPGLRRYREVVTKYYPKIDHTAWTVTSFVGANLFADTLKKLGLNVTRQRLKDALDSTTDYDLGLGTKVSYRPGQHHANTATHLVQLVRENDKLSWKSIGYDDRDTTYDK